MDKHIIEKTEQLLKAKIAPEEIVNNNPIFLLMQQSAQKIFDRDFSKTGMVFHFYYVIDYRINAYTLKFDNNAVICFTTGAINHISEIFAKMTESDKFRANFGDLDANKLAADLAVNSFSFLLFHEYGHLICGHTEYASASMNIAFMALFDSISGQFVLDRQTFEVQADVVAASYFSAIVRENNGAFNIIRLKIALSAIYVLFEIIFLFDRGRFLSDSLYLPSTYRMTNAFAIIVKDHIEEIKSIFEKVIKATEKGFYNIFRITSKRTQQWQNDLSKIDEHMKKIEDNWKILYNKVDSFSLVKLNPDIFDW